MTKLTDMQLVLLSTAASREDGSLLPPAESIGTRADRIRRAVGALLKVGLATEFIVTEKPRSWRQADDILYGVRISDDGRSFIDGATAQAMPPTSTATPPRASSKISEVIALLQRDNGASIIEIMETTGWLSHTTRAALTGLRKKGHDLGKRSADGVTRYSIKVVA
ncbi:DUF3489 domain-containing protein [Sphingomonas montanisoli]|uniref:DUF3489 domain-containing protein n=1 Tax=Sphingomonas montanisoli TaxID=2606412 RepID=A0A5D9C7J4_9SPHN|nr:DUF3489 domain-containing protein [Sphingomonas montanisoli]TZG25971.1 DUF3489 domain-containing protein [Sphingomonas montanisoli]